MTLRLLSSGPDVQALTRRLVALHLLAVETDIFGPEVAAAVKIFQSRHTDPRGEPLVIDGAVGPMTDWSIRVATGEAPPPAAGDRLALAMPAEGGTAIGRAALQVALGEYTGRAAEVGANNDGPFVVKYQHGRKDLRLQPWCASFASWCFEQAGGGTSPFGYSPSARGVLAACKAKGWVYAASDASPPQPGDLIVWWREPVGSGNGHIGIVHSYEHGVLRTIEGNRGNFPAPVGTFTYVLGRIEKVLGFARVRG